MVLSTLALSMHNVLVGIIGYGGRLFGQIPIESIFTLNIPNSLMLLWLRMVFVLPLLMLAAVKLYPPVWEDMRQLFRDPDRRPVYQVIASGSFLFMSQVLIYKAIADVGPGVAVTLLFMYPLITVPLAWFLFGDRPTPLRLVVMFAISMGIVFTALPRIYADLNTGTVSLWGVGAAILSSVAFALFLVAMQLSFRRMHPVPVSLMQFSTIFILTSLILIGGSFFGLNPGQPSSAWGLYTSGFLLGLLTLMGYLFNNYGVKLMGAAQASIVASSGPVMTAILAYVITPGEKSALSFIQWMGVVLVTLGVISLSLERLTHQQRAVRRKQVPAPATGAETAARQGQNF
jgi:drug/metabolite transporter (DMT)-like permease